MERAVVLAVLALVAGCGSSAPSSREGGGAPPVDEPPQSIETTQNQFDLTYEYDRALFLEDGLVYRESIGPYAVYEVTSAKPALRGPSIVVDDLLPDGVAMLCAAGAYFAGGADAAPPITALLASPLSPDGSFVEAKMASIDDGFCAPPSDDYGERLPEKDLDLEPPRNPSAPESAKIDIELAPAPPVGARVLFRRVALGILPVGHNDSHAIPPICCDGDGCSLDEAGSGETPN